MIKLIQFRNARIIIRKYVNTICHINRSKEENTSIDSEKTFEKLNIFAQIELFMVEIDEFSLNMIKIHFSSKSSIILHNTMLEAFLLKSRTGQLASNHHYCLILFLKY